MQNEIHEMFNRLKTERDTLKVKMHLGSMDAKEEFAEAEKKWQQLKTKLSSLTSEVADSSEEFTSAAKVIAEELRDTYNRIADRIKNK